MENKKTLEDWLNEEEYLPDFLKCDNNKRLLTDLILKKMDIPKEYISNCKDIYFKGYSFGFLKFAAQYGYTLKKSHYREDFIDFKQEVKELEEMSEVKIAPSANLRKWLIRDSDNPFYLPQFMKDFHDGKKIFSLYEREVKHPLLDKVTGHVYCSDFFLYFLARFGYLLRKSNKKLDFKNLQNSLNENNKREVDMLLHILNSK